MPQQRALDHTPELSEVIERYARVRDVTSRLCAPLSAEDMAVQAARCASPTKWHLAHTTWFFETFVLKTYLPGFRHYDSAFEVIFNSYYQTVGDRHPKEARGILSRPGLGEVMAFRDTVDERIRALDRALSTERERRAAASLIMLGLHHEQQHQELLLTDIKLAFYKNPIRPAYRDDLEASRSPKPSAPTRWVAFDECVTEIGHEGNSFSYDNELPRHRVFLEPYELASRPVTNREYAEFIEDDGYRRHELWLDEGWRWVQTGSDRPLYWSPGSEGREFTLGGERRLDPDAPVCHVCFFEADAFARWSKARLPTEAEWEHAAGHGSVEGRFVESDHLQPGGSEFEGLAQCFGDVWEWTRSSHEPYPGYRPPSGALGEYNGKFMCGTFVLRGGSCLSSRSHLRASYRNFLEPTARWQCSGLRLARSAN